MGEAPTGHTLTLTSTAEFTIPPPAESGARRFALVAFCRGEAELVELSAEHPVVVGRRAPSEVLLDDASVSRQHARFTVKDDRVFVEDLDSRNGTLLRGRKVTRELLEPGDAVHIGPAVLTLAATRAAENCEGTPDVIVVNEEMKRLYSLAERAADKDVPVLIVGETGTGKELLARRLHASSARSDRPFVAINCGAIPETLTESVLFGHERGAFTGAQARASGVFEQATGGVLFLDEIGEMRQSTQAALLRVLETNRINRVGGSREVEVDVRVVAATHCDIPRMIREGAFREDLYYRLSTLVLEVPPLRERPDEIAPLARHFLQEARIQWAARVEQIAPEVFGALETYEWPGNVRQLCHVIQRAALLCTEPAIRVADLPAFITSPIQEDELPEPPSGPAPLRDEMARYEATLIARALRRTAGNREAAAKLLRIPRRTFYRKLRQHGFLDSSQTVAEK